MEPYKSDFSVMYMKKTKEKIIIQMYCLLKSHLGGNKYLE